MFTQRHVSLHSHHKGLHFKYPSLLDRSSRSTSEHHISYSSTLLMVGATGATSGASSTSTMLSLHQQPSNHEHLDRTMIAHNESSPMENPPRAGSPLSSAEEYSDYDNSESSWDSEDYEEDSCRSRPAQAHLAVDMYTMRLPSGRLISSRSAAPSSTNTRRQPRHASPERLSHSANDGDSSEDTSSHFPANEFISTLSSTNDPLTMSKRSHKRQSRFTTLQQHHLRPSDQQALASLSNAQQRSLLATTQKQVESAQRAGREFVGKMDAYGNIKSKERFVNDVPGGKAHKNRFFAR